MVWGGRREEGSRWGTHVYLWRIHFDIWQNQYDIVKFKKKHKIIKKKRNKTLIENDTCASMFTEALISIAKRWKQF